MRIDGTSVFERFLKVTKPCLNCGTIMAILDGESRSYLWCFACEIRSELEASP